MQSLDITQDMRRLLNACRIKLPDHIYGMGDKVRIGHVSALFGSFHSGNLSFGSFSYSWSTIPFRVESVGRYSSVAGGVVFGEVEHPTDWLSTSSFVYDTDPNFIFQQHVMDMQSPFLPSMKSERLRRNIIIGNDVWIGARAYIRSGVTIGDGAIIGTQAVVTKDVEPYAIVAGNPGVVKKKRFSDAVIERLLALKWWDYDFTDFAGIDYRNMDQALPQLEEAIGEGRIPLRPHRYLTRDELLKVPQAA